MKKEEINTIEDFYNMCVRADEQGLVIEDQKGDDIGTDIVCSEDPCSYIEINEDILPANLNVEIQISCEDPTQYALTTKEPNNVFWSKWHANEVLPYEGNKDVYEITRFRIAPRHTCYMSLDQIK